MKTATKPQVKHNEPFQVVSPTEVKTSHLYAKLMTTAEFTIFIGELLTASRAAPDGGLVVGFDAEYDANGVTQVIQVSRGNNVAVYQLDVSPEEPLPQPLVRFFGSSRILKAGVAVDNDLSLLRQRLSIQCTGGFDVGLVAWHTGVTSAFHSLSDLASVLLGVEKAASRGCWAGYIGPQKLYYAANDAWAGLAIAEKLHATLAQQNETLYKWCKRLRPPPTEYHELQSEMQSTWTKTDKEKHFTKRRRTFKSKLEDIAVQKTHATRGEEEISTLVEKMKSKAPAPKRRKVENKDASTELSSGGMVLSFVE